MMNKVVNKFFCMIIVFVIITSMFFVPCLAISEQCVEDHFENLYATMRPDGEMIVRTPPSENTCPYVAMSLLLSFYDSYWNDNFVIDQYEWDNGIYNSTTDTLIETFSPINEAQSWEDHTKALNLPVGTDTYPYYPSYAAENTDNYLEPYLISIGKALNFHTSPNETLGLSDLETLAVLQAYLYIYRGFNINQVTVHYLHESFGDIEAKMREIIDDGYPVIYIGKKVNNSSATNTDNEGQTKSGHELIAYGIDQDNNIMLHTGWSGLEFCTYEGGSNPTEYNLSRAIIWLEINEDALPHQCSNNYVDLVTGEGLCACQIYASHEKHNDTHSTDKFYYKNCDDGTKSWTECYGCGEITNLHYHSLITTISDTHHRITCQDCGYDVFSEHDIKENYDNSKLWKECYCGYYVILHFHDLSYVDMNTNQHREHCENCDYIRFRLHQFQLESLNENQHQEVCACGRRRNLSDHYEYGYSYKSQFAHNIVCECGYILGFSPHSVVTDGPLKSHCTDCSAVFNTGSDIIIKGNEDEYELM